MLSKCVKCSAASAIKLPILKSGKIKSVIVGRRYRIPKLNILEYLDLIEKSTA